MNSEPFVVNKPRRKPLPFESLWSILHNFCRANLVEDEEVAAAITAFDSFERSERNLRMARWIDKGEASEMLSLSSEQFVRSLHEHYVCEPQDGVYAILVSRSVRFCPRCIEGGFHSPLHDLMYFKECPVHSVALTDRCPKCRKRLPFMMPRQASEAYSCICGHHFISSAGIEDIETIERRLRLAESWALGVRLRVIHAIALFLKDGVADTESEDMRRLLAEYSPSVNWYTENF